MPHNTRRVVASACFTFPGPTGDFAASKVFNFFSRVRLMVTFPFPSPPLSVSHPMSHLSQGSKDTGKQGREGEKGREGTNEWRKVLTHVAGFKLSIFLFSFFHTHVGVSPRVLSLSLALLAFFRGEKCLCKCRNCQWPYGTKERTEEQKRGSFGGENLRN